MERPSAQQYVLFYLVLWTSPDGVGARGGESPKHHSDVRGCPNLRASGRWPWVRELQVLDDDAGLDDVAHAVGGVTSPWTVVAATGSIRPRAGDDHREMGASKRTFASCAQADQPSV